MFPLKSFRLSVTDCREHAVTVFRHYEQTTASDEKKQGIFRQVHSLFATFFACVAHSARELPGSGSLQAICNFLGHYFKLGCFNELLIVVPLEVDCFSLVFSCTKNVMGVEKLKLRQSHLP